MAPFSPRVTTSKGTFRGACGNRLFEILILLQRGYFEFVGEEDIDHAFIHQREEIIAVAVDYERIGKREGDLAARCFGVGDGGAHRGARLFGVP